MVVEEMLKEINFDDDGLIPVIAQDYKTGKVVMLAYMNKEALEKTIDTGKAHYWSRSRKKLWLKGETSGHYQYIKSINIDCDADTLLIKVEQKGCACHTGHYSCFYRQLVEGGFGELQENDIDNEKLYGNNASVLKELYDVIADRKVNPKEGSYTNYLFEKGLDKILKKVGEEAAEVIIAAKNRSKDEIKYEIADLFYHVFVLLVDRGLKPDDIYIELKGRR
jgi:phosphoribosyl-ATP pyrophosphohydrolase/phosphoribosyl-AMP cyclohydrolase